jgi:ABC-2 type transport system permease protein
MGGTLALAGAEIRRLRRNRRYLIFTIGLPVLLYLILGKTTATEYGVSFKAFYMVAMAAFGALSGALNNNAMRISQERKEGWIRQLRLTPLPANGYVIILGSAYGGVSMPIWKWITIAIAVWFGTFIFAALAVAIGYKMSPDSVQPVTMLVFFFFSIFGGLMFPLGSGLESFAKFTPTFQVLKISTDVLGAGTVSAGYVIGVVVWFAIFLGLAVLAVRSTAESM